MKGTVFSGHPTRTTFGNTMRVSYYMKFTMYKANIIKYSLFVCGDDTLIIMEAREVDLFQ